MHIVQPNSLAAISRNLVHIPFSIRLLASHVKHFSISARQSIMPMLKYLYAGAWIPFTSARFALDFNDPACMMTRRTDVLRARTRALGWEIQRTVAGKRHWNVLTKDSSKCWYLKYISHFKSDKKCNTYHFTHLGHIPLTSLTDRQRLPIQILPTQALVVLL